jgi:hypothetical protein
MTRQLVTAAAALLVFSGVASAQTPPPKKPATPMGAMDHKMEHKMEGEMNHAMSPWKEMDAYHMLMMATWHPAKDKGDMAPTRAKINEMVASAKVLAASTAPKGCDSPKLKDAAAGLVEQTQGVADMVAKKADDVALKAAMKALHDKFDVLEEGCAMPKSGKH